MAKAPNSKPLEHSVIDWYVSTFFDTPARIVTANNTHFVLALTLPKELLRDNHHLLAALSDLAGE